MQKWASHKAPYFLQFYSISTSRRRSTPLKNSEQVRKRGDLLAFADDMLVMTSDRKELEHIVNELSSLSEKYYLRLNKKKSEILTLEKAEEIGGIRCT